MKIVINVEKKHVYAFALIIAIGLFGLVAVNAAAPPGAAFHTTLYTDKIVPKSGSGGVAVESNTLTVSGSSKPQIMIKNSEGKSWGFANLKADESFNADPGLSIFYPDGPWNVVFFIEASTKNVGIDTMNPTEKLDVNGNAKIAGNTQITGNADIDGTLTVGSGTITNGWPDGSYCIFKKGACPSGFTSGTIHIDTEDDDGANSCSGTLPDINCPANNLDLYVCCK